MILNFKHISLHELTQTALETLYTLASATSFGKEFHSFRNALNRKASSFACFKPSF